MVKAIVGLIVVCGIALGLVYFLGGYGKLDPTKQGETAKAKIKTGMTWKQVIDAAGKPGRYHIYIRVKKTIGGVETEVVEDGTELRFDRQLFENDLKANNMKEGFRLVWNFSPQSAFTVVFDAAGVATDIHDEKTMADLLGTRK
jgi:hypothetical protein